MQKVKIGIVGLHFGRKIVEQLLNGPGSTYFDIAALCDLDKERAMFLANRINVKAYTDFDQMLEDKEIPCVGLFTGPSGRSGLIKKAIRAGKNVMTTKPFELNANEALTVLTEARQLGRIIHLNSPSPLLTRDIMQIKYWVDKYNLGRPISCQCGIWTSHREKADGNWHDDPVKCPVAPVFRIGIYLINDILRLFGEADKVQVMHSRIFTGRPTPDNAHLNILFKNGALGNISASYCVNDGQSFGNSMVLNYENGTIYRNRKGKDANIMHLISHDNCLNPVLDEAGINESSGVYQWEAFYKAINGEKLENDTMIDDIVMGVKVIEAMAKAEKSGCSIDV